VTEWGEPSWGYGLSVTNLAPLARPVEVHGSVDTATPGIYTLTYTARNPHGIMGTALRTVIVEDPNLSGVRGLKSNVLAELTVMLAQANQRKPRELLQNAAAHLSESLNPAFWVDATRVSAESGARVFEQEKAAASELRRLLHQTLAPSLEAQTRDCISNILAADRLLAVVALQDAAEGGADPGRIARAWRFVSDGDQASAAGKVESAVEHYRNGWHHANLLRLRIATRLVNGATHLDFAAVPGRTYEVQTSTNLTDWIALGHGTIGPDGRAHLEQPATSAGQVRFYRIRISGE
jgi:hypothetical protein